MTPKQFHEDLKALGDIDELHVYINSGGGDVFAGQAIHSMLKRHPANVVVYVDGLAASIASVIAMAGNKRIIPRNAMMMIHHPWTWGVGNAADFRKLADNLDQIGESIIATYMDATGMSREDLIPLLDAETWLTAEEAVAMGFADEIEESKQVAAAVRDGKLIVNGQQMDLSRYKHPPKLALLPVATPDPAPPDPVADTDPEPNEPTDQPPADNPPPEPDPDPNAQRQPTVAPLSLFERQLQMNERGM